MTKVLDQKITEKFAIYNGDSCEIIGGIPSNSIHYSVFSPPFASLYTYSNSERDAANAKTDEEFFEHFGFLASEINRVLMPGRLVSIHCMNLPTSKAKDGYIGLRDFRGDIIRLFQKVGFIFHSEVVIWKDPVVAMQRTKALGLLHKQIIKDSAMSRQGIPDYLVTFRKIGTNTQKVSGGFDQWIGEGEGPSDQEYTNEFDSRNRYSINVWQKYASPIWTDIRQGNVLSYREARDEEDERHICPLQLDVIERALELWSNPNDIVLSPFMGIGSEGFCSLRAGRKFIGMELKESYYKQSEYVMSNYDKLDTDKGKNKKPVKFAEQAIAIDPDKAVVDTRQSVDKTLKNVLPKLESKPKELVEPSNLFVEVFKETDMIENHVNKHTVETGGKRTLQLKDKTFDNHTSKYDFPSQFYLAMLYKFVKIESNGPQVKLIKGGKVPASLTRGIFAQFDTPRIIDDISFLLSNTVELRNEMAKAKIK